MKSWRPPEIKALRAVNSDKSWSWNTRFIGVPMLHNYWQYHEMGRILELNRHLNGIAEIGAWKGALSIYLGLWGIRLGIPVITFETDRQLLAPIEHILKRLSVRIYGDCFEGGRIEEFIGQRGPIWLICDGGDKAREVRTFAPVLAPGSLISAHDWLYEIFPHDVEGLGLTPYREDEWMAMNMGLATWRVV